MHSLEIWCDIMSGYSSGFLSCETLTLAITSTAPKSIPEGLIQLFSPGLGPLSLPSRTPAAAWLVVLPLSFHVMVCLPRWRVWEAKPQADTSIQSARTHFVVPLADFVLFSSVPPLNFLLMPEVSACQACFPATVSFFFLHLFLNFLAPFAGGHSIVQCSNPMARGRHRQMKHLCDKAKATKLTRSSFATSVSGLGLSQSIFKETITG